MQIDDIRGKTPDELKEQVSTLKKELFNLRFQAATGELENTSRSRQARRDIARIQTVLRERALGKVVAPKAEKAPKVKTAAKKPAAKKTTETKAAKPAAKKAKG